MGREGAELIRQYADVRERRAALILLRRELAREGRTGELDRIDHTLARLKYRELRLWGQLTLARTEAVRQRLERALRVRSRGDAHRPPISLSLEGE